VVVACLGSGPMVTLEFLRARVNVGTGWVDRTLRGVEAQDNYSKAQSPTMLFGFVLTCRVTHVTQM
jgi:hypothetical protein